MASLRSQRSQNLWQSSGMAATPPGPCASQRARVQWHSSHITGLDHCAAVCMHACMPLSPGCVTPCGAPRPGDSRARGGVRRRHAWVRLLCAPTPQSVACVRWTGLAGGCALTLLAGRTVLPASPSSRSYPERPRFQEARLRRAGDCACRTAPGPADAAMRTRRYHMCMRQGASREAAPHGFGHVARAPGTRPRWFPGACHCLLMKTWASSLLRRGHRTCLRVLTWRGC